MIIIAVEVVLPWVPATPMVGISSVMADRSRRHQLKVGVWHRRGRNHDVHLSHPLGSVARPRLHPELAQGGKGGSSLEIGSANRQPHLMGQLRQSAHTGTAGPNHVQPRDSLQISHEPWSSPRQ
jgi:hypothetical protein